MAAHNDLGKWGEETAANFLERKGYVIIERDWQMGHRDVDIIAANEENIVFVEVKTRNSNFLVPPEQAVTRDKIRSLSLAANAYVKMHRYSLPNLPLRFDIIAIVAFDEDNCTINHIENAFLPLPTYRGRGRNR